MEELPQLGRPICVIGRYALYGKLAAGGMATVHFGRLLGPAGFSRTVAIKRLHPQFAKDPEFVAMFLDEARLAARIQHPNVVATVDVVATAEELFLVMDYIRGESFSRLLRASRKKGVEVPLGVVLSVAAGMLHGLHAAHEAKDEQGRPLSVVHRDVSPQNVLVGTDGVPRVLDFGVAKAAARIQVTRDGQMKGKLSYMAPEQLQGKGVDRRTDVFAAAIVTWEALTGRRLFDAEEPQEVLRMIVSEDIPPPSAVVPSIPRAVDAIVMKGLTRDVTKRYQSARQFAIALEEAAPLASPREVGEWVERVAGDTLLRREQAVAEIEAVSAVSDISSISGAAPGFTSTMVGLAPPPAAKASDWDDGPTRVYDSSAAVSAGDDKATRVHGPRPASISSPPPPVQVKPPRIPSLVPPAARAPQRMPPSASPAPRGQPAPRPSAAPPARGQPAPRQSAPAPRQSAPAPRQSVPAAQSEPTLRRSGPPPLDGRTKARSVAASAPPPAAVFDDSDETQVKMPSAAEDFEKRPVLDKSQPTWDDEGETTQVIDKSGADELLDAAARVTSPPAKARRPSNLAPRPAAGSPPAVTTVIVQDHTSPALLRKRPAPWTLGIAWLWGSPTARARRVGMVAGVAGLLVGVALYAARLKHPAPRRPLPDAVETSPPPLPTHLAVTAAPEPPAPRGIDPSMLPPAPPEEPESRHAVAVGAAGAVGAAAVRARPSETTEDVRKPSPVVSAPKSAAPAKAVEAPKEAPAPAPEPAPAPAAVPPSAPESDNLESPYAHAAAKPSKPAAAPAPVAPPPAAAVPKPVPTPKATAAPKASAPKSPAAKAPAGCDQPFTVDEHGIKRIKPECL